MQYITLLLFCKYVLHNFIYFLFVLKASLSSFLFSKHFLSIHFQRIHTQRAPNKDIQPGGSHFFEFALPPAQTRVHLPASSNFLQTSAPYPDRPISPLPCKTKIRHCYQHKSISSAILSSRQSSISRPNPSSHPQTTARQHHKRASPDTDQNISLFFAKYHTFISVHHATI